MKWSEFSALLTGLSPESALGRLVSIRAEDDANILKHFSKEQHRIRNEWRSRKVKNVKKKDLESFLEQMKSAFIAMAGGGGA